MAASASFIEEIYSDIQRAAKQVSLERLDHHPPLIVFECLTDASEVLSAAALARLQAGGRAVTETLTMPRRGFGPRPVEVLSPVSRTVYTSLVEHLSDSIPPPSRGGSSWAEHETFGLDGAHSYVVEMDFASCYELIEHEDLTQELLLRSYDHETVTALISLLRGVGRRGRGLPQMLHASDRLADTYLDIIDRRLRRKGRSLHRYADDIRVLADDWDRANEVIEETGAYARELGLILSSEKTSIRLRRTLAEDIDHHRRIRDEFFKNHANAVLESQQGPYHEPDQIYSDAYDAATGGAFIRFLTQWHEDFADRDSASIERSRFTTMSGLIPAALAALSNAPEPLEEALLADLVFQDPTRLEFVSNYVLGHLSGPHADHDFASSVIDNLTSMGRQGSWSKLWLLRVTTQLSGPSRQTARWMHQQLLSTSEVVRAEAAWACATHGLLRSDELQGCYSSASELSMPGLSAAASRQSVAASDRGSSLSPDILAAIEEDSPLNRKAAQWAKQS